MFKIFSFFIHSEFSLYDYPHNVLKRIHEALNTQINNYIVRVSIG